jgi:hypothetical protein
MPDNQYEEMKAIFLAQGPFVKEMKSIRRTRQRSYLHDQGNAVDSMGVDVLRGGGGEWKSIDPPVMKSEFS